MAKIHGMSGFIDFFRVIIDFTTILANKLQNLDGSTTIEKQKVETP